MASNSYQSKGIAFIDEIYNAARSKQFTKMMINIMEFTLFIESNRSLIYSSINRYFQTRGLALILLKSTIGLTMDFAVQILKLLHIFIQTNIAIRKEVKSFRRFIKYLSTTLSTKSSWKDMELLDYHIHIAAHLIVDSNLFDELDSISVLTLVSQKLNEDISTDNYKTCILFQACLMLSQNLQCRKSELIKIDSRLSSTLIDIFTENIENYLKDFSKFYNNENSENNQYLYYDLQSKFTFEQLCHAILYYSSESEELCLKIFENDIFMNISKILLIRYIPQEFVIKLTHILRRPLSHLQIRSRFKKEYYTICDMLNNYLENDVTSDISRNKLGVTLKEYFISDHLESDFNIPSIKEIPFSLSSLVTSLDSYSFSKIDSLTTFNIKRWLQENNLIHLSSALSELKGKELYQLKQLLNEVNGRFKVTNLMLSKMNLDVYVIFHFLDCLESWNMD